MTFGQDKGHNFSIPEALRLASDERQAGRLSQAEALCQRVLLEAPNHVEAMQLHWDICRQLDGNVRSAVENFQRSLNPATIGAIRDTRREVITFLQQQPTELLVVLWTSPFREAHGILMKSGLRDHIRDKQEEAVLDRLVVVLSAVPPDPARPAQLLAAMLLSHSYELPLHGDLLTLPEWLLESYVEFLLERPEVHNRIGDAEAYIGYLSRLVGLIHRFTIAEYGITDDPAARHLIDLFAVREDFIQAYFNTCNLRDLYAQRGDLIAAALIVAGNRTLTVLPPRTQPKGKIRIGIYAGQFGPHTETYFTLSHFEALDRSRFDITLYAAMVTGHPLEQYCISRADRFVVLPQYDIANKVQRIRADDLDVLLISTNMTTRTNTATLLGAYRLARIQVASVSSPVTTGGRHMDVLLSAEWNEPAADAANQYTEYLHLLPGSVNYYAYQYDNDPANITIRRVDIGVDDEQLVFFSGANYFKILPELSLVWVKILALVPNSVLVLMPFNPNWCSEYQTIPFVERIHRQMSEYGVETSRLTVINPVPTRADVHSVIALADVYLDAYPFAGACSLLDPIIVGVPVVVRRGPVGRSNHGASLMRMIGLEELITESEEQYISAAVDIANDREKRQHIRNRLYALRACETPPYFETREFSNRVDTALSNLYEQYLSRYRGLENMDGLTLRRHLQYLADSVVGNNFELNTLSDIGLVHSLIEPFFRIHHGRHQPRMVDVGACYGKMAAPFLAAGWSADLFEPDPGARKILEKNMAVYGQRCRIFASAVSNISANKVSFHKSKSHGLSGLGDSPYCPTERVIDVPCVRLDDFYLQQGIDVLDFLKIDAEGNDFDVLESHDFTHLKPRLILIEYGTHFPRQPLDLINQNITRMAELGYGAITFNYTDDGNFQKAKWVYRLVDIFVDCQIPLARLSAFGNIVFYRSEDKDFLLTLFGLLENCLPRAQVWRKAGL